MLLIFVVLSAGENQEAWQNYIWQRFCLRFFKLDNQLCNFSFVAFSLINCDSRSICLNFYAMHTKGEVIDLLGVSFRRSAPSSRTRKEDSSDRQSLEAVARVLGARYKPKGGLAWMRVELRKLKKEGLLKARKGKSSEGYLAWRNERYHSFENIMLYYDVHVCVFLIKLYFRKRNHLTFVAAC